MHEEEDERNHHTLLQTLYDGMEDAVEAFFVGDDNGGWHKGRQSSYDGESIKDNNEVKTLGGELEALTWPPEVL